MTLKWWNENKMWVSPPTALVLWVVSVVCFVFGLSFKNPIMVMGTDISIYLAFALSMCNTAIQLIGNGYKFTEDDWVFLWIWRASYALGISSNTNTLLQIIGMNNVYLEWIVSVALGMIIEIAPEKLIVMWLKSQPAAPKPQSQQFKPNNQPNRPSMPNMPKPKANPQWPPKPNQQPMPFRPIQREDEE